MAGPLLAAALLGSFTCVAPTHHDGDNVRCANIGESIRLQGIDAPEMPGACRPGRACTPGDPYAARDTLRALSHGQTLQCQDEGRDRYGRIIARCSADGVDLSCAMIASGQAVPRYAPIDCSGAPRRAEAPDQAEPPAQTGDVAAERPVIPASDESARPALSANIAGLAALALLVVNLVTFVLFAIDKRRAVTGRSRERIPERTLIAWAMLGGSPAAWLAVNRLRHKSARDSFKAPLLMVTGLQIGLLLGGLWWWLT